ncbi:MAG: phosphatidylserine decarboxylase family protein [Verrucomicrobia bacterium]|nr:phosphatidylserine decarboxylase family protein [Verrucomicrobiota bacterium]
MRHAGKARRAGWTILFWSLVLLVAMVAGGVVAALVSSLIAAVAAVLAVVWLVFALFTLYFFRDPEPLTPTIPNAIVAPAHGKVDAIGEAEEPAFMGGVCQRISIFMSVLDVHVQRAPVSGTVAYQHYTPGQFLSATKAQSAEFNENALVGLTVKEYPGEKIAMRLIAGIIARRIVSWVGVGDVLERSDRVSLIRYGSRVDLYLPRSVKLHVKLGEKVKGGETIVASFP